jgi:hypothetical protein
VPVSQLFPRRGLFQTAAINFRSGRRAARAPRAVREWRATRGGSGLLRTSLTQCFPVNVRVLKTTKTTWLVRLEMRPETSADGAEPAENYG